nr:zf-HC2 domain-containing protein [Lutispora saccharofermentans]
MGVGKLLCSRVRKSLHSYAAGETEGLEHFLIKEHLDNCPSCKAEYERILEIKSILSNMGRNIAVPCSLVVNIMEAIDLEKYKAIGIHALNNLRNFGISFIAAGLIISLFSVAPGMGCSNKRFIGRSMAKVQESILKPFEVLNNSVISISDKISNLNEAMSANNE